MWICWFCRWQLYMKGQQSPVSKMLCLPRGGYEWGICWTKQIMIQWKYRYIVLLTLCRSVKHSHFDSKATVTDKTPSTGQFHYQLLEYFVNFGQFEQKFVFKLYKKSSFIYLLLNFKTTLMLYVTETLVWVITSYISN